MNREINDPFVRRKYGNNVVLTKENIKDIYFITICNTFKTSEYIELFLRKNYSKEEILKWNDEYVNLELDEIDKLLLEECNYEHVKEITYKFYHTVRVYSENKETYIRIIETLKRYFNKYGYFSCYPVMDLNSYDEAPFSDFNLLYVRKAIAVDYMKNSSGAIFKYHKNVKYVGLIAVLYYLKYTDLMKQVFKEIIIPIRKNPFPKSDIMEENGLLYTGDKDEPLSQLYSYFIINDFVKEFNIKLDFDI